MNIQDLISQFTTTNISFKTLAKSYFELSYSKSQEWMRRLDLSIEAATASGVDELNQIISERYSDIIDTPLPLDDGSAVSLREYVFAILDEEIDVEEHTINDKRGKPHTISSITQYMSDQGVNLTAQICAFQAVMDATIDEVTGRANVQFSNYYTLVQSQLGEMSQRGKSIVNYYYNILSDSTVDMTTKLQLMLAPIQDSVTNYNEDDDSLDIEFFVPQTTYTGISSFAAWCISNDISWNSAWNVIKSGFKVIGTVIEGLWNGIKSIANKIFGYVTQPFNPDQDIIKQRSKYTTNYIDIPVAQGRATLSKIFSTDLSLASSQTINSLCQYNGFNVDEVLQYINDKVNSQSITSVDFTSFRLLLWQDKDDSDAVSFMINVSPIATGSIRSVPCYNYDYNYGDPVYVVERGINECLNNFYPDTFGDDIDLNSSSDLFKGIMCSLNNIALITGAAVLSQEDLDDPVCDIPGGDVNKSNMTQQQAETFKRISSFIGGYRINQLSTGDQTSTMLSYPNQFVDYGTNGDWYKAEGNAAPTNADVARIICNSDFSIIDDSATSLNAARGRGMIACIIWLFIRQHFSSNINDQSIFIPYTHIYSVGSPRFVLKGDPTGAAFAVWLTVATTIAVSIVAVGASLIVRRMKRRKLASWQATQWKSTDIMANNPVGSEIYNTAQKQLMKANKKIQRIESFLEITGGSSLTSLATGIDLTSSSTDTVVRLIRGDL